MAFHKQNTDVGEILALKDTELHLCTFKTPILEDKKICKNVKSIVGISPTMVVKKSKK